MNFCPNCGQQLDSDHRFCTNCGAGIAAEPETVEPAAPVQEAAVPAFVEPACSVTTEARPAQIMPAEADADELAREKACLDSFHHFLRKEKLMWKIVGILFLVLCGLMVLGGLFSFGDGGWIYLLEGILYLPIGIICLCMIRRVDYYLNTLYTDAKPMVKRCGSVGMIILGAMFNTLAMIFIIVNFVRVKNNAALLQNIIARQEAYRSNRSL